LEVLDAVFERVSNPKSSHWGKFLKPEEIDDLVRPEQDTFAAIQTWLEVVAPYSTITVRADHIRVRTFTAGASKLFGVPFHYYTHDTLKNKIVVR
jgi:hypothetical protein